MCRHSTRRGNDAGRLRRARRATTCRSSRRRRRWCRCRVFHQLGEYALPIGSATMVRVAPVAASNSARTSSQGDLDRVVDGLNGNRFPGPQAAVTLARLRHDGWLLPRGIRGRHLALSGRPPLRNRLVAVADTPEGRHAADEAATGNRSCRRRAREPAHVCVDPPSVRLPPRCPAGDLASDRCGRTHDRGPAGPEHCSQRKSPAGARGTAARPIRPER